MIWGSRPRFRGRSGRSGPVMRGMGTLSRALGLAWRRSLQLRVLALTLGMSLTVLRARSICSVAALTLTSRTRLVT